MCLYFFMFKGVFYIKILTFYKNKILKKFNSSFLKVIICFSHCYVKYCTINPNPLTESLWAQIAICYSFNYHRHTVRIYLKVCDAEEMPFYYKVYHHVKHTDSKKCSLKEDLVKNHDLLSDFNGMNCKKSSYFISKFYSIFFLILISNY